MFISIVQEDKRRTSAGVFSHSGAIRDDPLIFIEVQAGGVVFDLCQRNGDRALCDSLRGTVCDVEAEVGSTMRVSSGVTVASSGVEVGSGVEARELHAEATSSKMERERICFVLNMGTEYVDKETSRQVNICVPVYLFTKS